MVVSDFHGLQSFSFQKISGRELWAGTGLNRIYTPYMTVCMVISLPKILYIHHIYLQMYGYGQPYV